MFYIINLFYGFNEKFCAAFASNALIILKDDDVTRTMPT